MGRSGWNHNVHHHPVVLAAIPLGARRVLDVGCGDGALARELSGIVPEVVGIDRDEPTLRRAAARGTPGVTWVLGDVLDHPFRPGSFDLVASVAALHHFDAEAGLRRMAELLRPGGRLAIVGLARDRFPRDLPRVAVATVVTRLLRGRRGYQEVAAPTVWPPPHTYREMRTIAERVLPGFVYRRHLLWRYSLLWHKPGEAVDRRDGIDR
jgi:SAM-dependent methyltransferase